MRRESLNPDNILLEDFLLLGENYFWFLEHIDAWSGVLFETIIPGGLVGQTNAAIIGDQFKRLKFGDRFFLSHETESSVYKREALQRTLSAGCLISFTADSKLLSDLRQCSHRA